MTASINGRALTDGEFVCVVDGITYVGLVRAWNYTQAAPEQQPAVTLDGVITDQQRNEPPADQELAVRHAPAGPRGRLTVQILPWSALPLVGDRDTLYIVSDPLTGAPGVFDEAAYVYRPDDREGPDHRPYKPTNVSAAVVARLHDSGDQIRSQAAITRGSLAVPVQYTLAERPNDQLEVCTSDNFVTWMPISWRLNEIPVRSRPGHVFVPEVRNELARLAIDEIDEVTRSELLRRAARQAVASAFSEPVVTYVSSLDELPVRGEEHRLYCIYGYEAAYIYRRGQDRPYRPTNLSAAALAENYADGATLERAPSALVLSIVISYDDDYRGWCSWRQRDEQGEYCCLGRLLLPAGVRGEPLAGRRDNTAYLRVDFSAPLVTAIPTQAVQGNPVTVPIPRDLSLEQVAEMRGVTLNITQTQANWRSSASFSQAFFNPRANATDRAPAEAPPAPFVPQMLPVTAGPRRILPLNG